MKMCYSSDDIFELATSQLIINTPADRKMRGRDW